MKAQKSHYVSATAIVIETRNNVLRNRKLDLETVCSIAHTSTGLLIHIDWFAGIHASAF